MPKVRFLQNQKLREKVDESLSAVIPITVIVILISTFLIPMNLGTLTMFFAGALMLILGMGLFQLGAEMAMEPMGEGIGTQMSKSKRVWVVVLIAFGIGFVVTIAEPDLLVLADQVSAIPDAILIGTVAVGVAVFLVIAVLRVRYRIALSTLLIIFYTIMVIFSFLIPENFVAIAFDAGGVTTGPITVPFIIAVGVGLASMRSDKDVASDSFGFVALCSIGPILAVMVLGLFYNPDEAAYTATQVVRVGTMQEVAYEFGVGLPTYALEVLVAFLPIVAVFGIFQLATRRFHKRQIGRIIVGLIYTYVGLVLFLCGVGIGFAPVGSLLGAKIADSAFQWLLVPVGMVIGYFIVKAEPAIQILNKQVADVTDDAISEKLMYRCLQIGVAISVGLAMLRIVLDIPLHWIIIPGYIIALVLSRIVPKMFVGIAFDSGGVASGPMATTFLLPLCIGTAEALGGNVLTDAFGVVALVALTPLIAVQIMGLVYKIKAKRADDDSYVLMMDDTIELEEEE